jgi:hypothetical protein
VDLVELDPQHWYLPRISLCHIQHYLHNVQYIILKTKFNFKVWPGSVGLVTSNYLYHTVLRIRIRCLFDLWIRDLESGMGRKLASGFGIRDLG